MSITNSQREISFAEAVRGLLAGDFTRLAPLFEAGADGSPCRIVRWYEGGLFAAEPEALAEAFSCACFNGFVPVVEYFLSRGVDPNGGAKTGMNAFHWAADRGQSEVVEILIRDGASLEAKNMYGGTVLGGAVWSAAHELRPGHSQVIEALLRAGARVGEVSYPSGNRQVDEILRRHGAGEQDCK